MENYESSQLVEKDCNASMQTDEITCQLCNRPESTLSEQSEETKQCVEQQNIKEEEYTKNAPVKKAEAWGISFALPKTKRKATVKERRALQEAKARQMTISTPTITPNNNENGADCNVIPFAATNTCEATNTINTTSSELAYVNVNGLEDESLLIPRNLVHSSRAALSERVCLSISRLLCVNKQYPRSCGVSSLTSIYNYLYSWLGECDESQSRPPISQEEVMSILGFAPPFAEYEWGSFTGNATLMRWFHALNRHFGLRGKCYILYKAYGSDNTWHLYENNKEALQAVKCALRNPHCALIYHCHNHYMVPIGFQDIPIQQVDFFQPNVDAGNCETTIYIADVSRGKHEAMYARKWSEIVCDIESKLPQYFDIRRTHLGIQTREAKKSRKRLPQEEKEYQEQEQEECKVNTESPVAFKNSWVGVTNYTKAERELEEKCVDDCVEENCNNTPTISKPSTSSCHANTDIKNVVCNESNVNEHVINTSAIITNDERNSSAMANQNAIDANIDANETDRNKEQNLCVREEQRGQQMSEHEKLEMCKEEELHKAKNKMSMEDNVVVIHQNVHKNATAKLDNVNKCEESEVLPSLIASKKTNVIVNAIGKVRRERGNLHCLICFRNDEAEENLERYENSSSGDEQSNYNNEDKDDDDNDVDDESNDILVK